MTASAWMGYVGVLLVIFRINLAESIILESIYWNTSNTKFVPGRGLILYPQIGDKLDVVCPRITGLIDRGKVEYFRVYLVDQKDLENCRVPKDRTPLLNCDKPEQDVKFTFKFQEFSPNLWGLEFGKGKNYYIISTSNSSLEGIDNHEGGVCKSKSMKMILRIGQNPADPVSKVNPTRHPPIQYHPDLIDSSNKKNEVISIDDTEPAEGPALGSTASPVILYTSVAGGALIFIIIIVTLVVLLYRRHISHSTHTSTQMSLGTLATPKHSHIGSNNNGSEPSDIIFPLQSADGMYCPHYEKVSGDYGHPVYIVQEMPPQSPANIYYKV
ncbi:ephrin-B2a-like [Denticeps clupeoides]|uniref:Ephrin RBD domain-containing protein n=1 Tax=Denticeps clupeoides TaxID=299321 RepID=A0AAY4EPE2_9TELE|nr:ephrin-B2a-like [Denticeps clupeoides]